MSSVEGFVVMIANGSFVSKRSNVQGGDACVRDTRIPVWVLVNFRRLGAADGEILRAYPSLTQSDLDAAFDYAAAHPQEIDQAIRENEKDDGPVE